MTKIGNRNTALSILLNFYINKLETTKKKKWEKSNFMTIIEMSLFNQNHQRPRPS